MTSTPKPLTSAPDLRPHGPGATQVATPLLWAFLDLGAAWTRHGDLDAGAAFWLNGLASWLVLLGGCGRDLLGRS